MRLSLYLAAAATFVAAAPAHAADWRVLGTLQNGVVMYVDVDASQPYDDGTIDMWTKNIYPRIQSDGTKYTVVNSTVDCNDMTDATTEINSYRINGGLIDTFNYRDRVQWTGLTPDSMWGEFARKLCAAKFGEYR